MSSIKSASKKKRAPVARQQRRANGSATAAEAASAAPAPAAHAYAQEEDTEQLAAALESVEELLEQSDLGAAERLLRSPALLGRLRAADIQQQHKHLVPAMELMAQVLMEKSRTKEAFAWLRASCMLEPDGGAERWMYYGQLIGGHDALQAFKNGIGCMLKTRGSIIEKQAAARQRELTNAFTMGEHEGEQVLAQQLQAIDKQISSGYTSMAELYVTDCCDDDGAERECEKLLQLALTSCPDNPDALYASANLRTIQGRVDDATELMTRCLSVLAACRARSIESMGVLALGAPDQQDPDAPVQAAINLYDVSYELRVACAKLALELGQLKPAYTLLEQLLEEDDRVIEVSHLAAVCAHSLGDFRAGLAHIERASELLDTEESDAMMGGGGEDGEDGEEPADEDEAQQAAQAEEIATTKRALAELRALCIEGAKTQPEEEDDEEAADGADEAPAAAASAAGSGAGDAMAE